MATPRRSSPSEPKSFHEEPGAGDASTQENSDISPAVSKYVLYLPPHNSFFLVLYIYIQIQNKNTIYNNIPFTHTY